MPRWLFSWPKKAAKPTPPGLHTGSISQTLSKVTHAGTLAHGSQGTIAQTLAGVIHAGILIDTPAAGEHGSISQTLSKVTHAGALVRGIPGTIAQTLSKVIHAGTLVDTPAAGETGSITQTLMSVKHAGTLVRGIPGSIAQTLFPVVHAGVLKDTPGTGGGGSQNPPFGQGYYQNPNFFTYARQSGQAYASTPSFAVAGVNFPVGIPTGVTLADPTLSVPPNCTLSPTGSKLGGPLINCGSFAHPPTNPTISGYDFSLYGGVPLVCTQMNGTLTIDRCKFVTGNNVSLVQGTGIGTFNTTTFTLTSLTTGSPPVVGQTLQGPNTQTNLGGAPTIQAVLQPWNGSTAQYQLSFSIPAPGGSASGPQSCYWGLSQGSLVNISSPGLTAIVISNCYVDGNAINNPMGLAAAFTINAPNASLTVNSSAWLRLANRGINGPGPGAILAQSNYIENLNYSFGNGIHGEWILASLPSGSTCPSQRFVNNTFLQGGTPTFGGTTAFIFNECGAATITQIEVIDNVAVANSQYGGTYKPLSVCLAEIGTGNPPGTIGSWTAIGNYVDHTGAFFSFQNAGSTVGSQTWSGNVNMVTGAAITQFGVG